MESWTLPPGKKVLEKVAGESEQLFSQNYFKLSLRGLGSSKLDFGGNSSKANEYRKLRSTLISLMGLELTHSNGISLTSNSFDQWPLRPAKGTCIYQGLKGLPLMLFNRGCDCVRYDCCLFSSKASKLYIAQFNKTAHYLKVSLF